jgi:hypothetical protein
MTGDLREIHKRLKRLEANRKMECARIASSPAAIEQAALGKLSAADRALFQSKGTKSSEDTQEYQDFLTRWEAALAAASWAAGVPYLTTSDRAWL